MKYAYSVTASPFMLFVPAYSFSPLRQKSNLNAHLRAVHGERRFACPYPYCVASFEFRKSLLAHAVAEGHGNPADMPLSTPSTPLQPLPLHDAQHSMLCDDGDGAEAGVDNENGDGGGDGIGRFTDGNNGEAFAGDDDVGNAGEGSTEVREHACVECGKSFLKASRLTRHMVSHTGEVCYYDAALAFF